MSLKRDEAGASRRRRGERGVAPIELALSLVVLVPLVLGMIDLGYYFYVAVTAGEAARVGARNVSKATVGPCSNTTAANTAGGVAEDAAEAYFDQAGIGSITRTATASCGAAAGITGPVWTVSMQVDFRPLVGVARTWLKPSPDTSCVGCVTFTQAIRVPGN